MSITQVQIPIESKKVINKAGQILVLGDVHSTEYQKALELADRWRACHAYPINTFQANMRTILKTGKYQDGVIAQRLKRMPTIIDKLKRHPNMKLTTMQDIGGVRAILANVSDVYRFADKYRKNTHLKHKLINEKDYIRQPKSADKEDGYRSLHLIYGYENDTQYDGLKIELQIRTKLQHIWATAVETMGTFLGQSLKSRQGEPAWLDFFSVVSSAFAHMEKTVPVPKYADLSKRETWEAVVSAEEKIQALSQMRGFSAALISIQDKMNLGKLKEYSYYLIVLNSLEHSVRIRGYDSDKFQNAVSDYSSFEAEATAGKKIEPVLVSVRSLRQLERAYPNFFLNMDTFIKHVTRIVEEAK